MAQRLSFEGIKFLFFKKISQKIFTFFTLSHLALNYTRVEINLLFIIFLFCDDLLNVLKEYPVLKILV
jgi:hypothetical protein